MNRRSLVIAGALGLVPQRSRANQWLITGIGASLERFESRWGELVYYRAPGYGPTVYSPTHEGNIQVGVQQGYIASVSADFPGGTDANDAIGELIDFFPRDWVKLGEERFSRPSMVALYLHSDSVAENLPKDFDHTGNDSRVGEAGDFTAYGIGLFPSGAIQTLTIVLGRWRDPF